MAEANIIERGLITEIEHPGRLGMDLNWSTIFINQLFLNI